MLIPISAYNHRWFDLWNVITTQLVDNHLNGCVESAEQMRHHQQITLCAEIMLGFVDISGDQGPVIVVDGGLAW